MEELLNNIFVSYNFPQAFSQSIWKQIRQEISQSFQKKQQAIYQLIINSSSLQNIYWPIFRNNHATFYKWYLLANREKNDMKQYIFSKLLQKQPKNQKFTIKKHRQKQSMTQPNEIKKMLADYQSSPKLKDSVLYNVKIDNHDLYLKTFFACHGNHYSPYDYDKHMKCQMQRSNYNKYIRPANSHRRNQTAMMTEPNQLQKFEEFSSSKEKISLMNVRSILKNSKLNNENGLYGLLRKRKNNKLVLVNHQRKPISYYLFQK